MAASSTSSTQATSAPVSNKDSIATQDAIGCSHAFPVVLYEILESAETTGLDEILCWMPNGRAFKVHDKKRFLKEIVPKHFRLTKYKSFCRQMNLWNFKLEKIGTHKGEYSNPYFRKGDRHLCLRMVRLKKSVRASASTLKSQILNDNANSLKLVSNKYYQPAATIVTGSMIKNINTIPLHLGTEETSSATTGSSKSFMQMASQQDIFGLLDLDTSFCAATDDDDELKVFASLVMEPRPIEAMVDFPYNVLD